MFKKILIANRGEIAVRVIKTCRRLGVKTVVVYSDADAGSMAVEMADETVHIGPSPAAESYLVMDKIIDAVKQTGAEAVHPGFGFLSENPAFAKRLEKEKIVFIGPNAHAIEAMGDKISSKKLAADAGVSTVPGHMGLIKNTKEAVKISNDPQRVDNAIERFLGKSPAEIGTVAHGLIEGSLREVIPLMTAEDLRGDRPQFDMRFTKAAEDEFYQMGLQLDWLKLL